MANPSSSRHDVDDRGDRGTERERRHRSDRERRSTSSSSHHHHRTISSTTLLLVLSLILAVLAVMLSLPNSATSTVVVPPIGKEPEDLAKQQQESQWGILTPKRSQALVARESSVASREAEVARREAEMLVGAPGGVIPIAPSQTICEICVPAPAQTVIKEVVQESGLAAPQWYKDAGHRAEEILDRELKIAEREREISKREESVNRREHDASRRESWIMEQLIALGSDHPPQSVHEAVEEEYVSYEQPKRKLKVPPPTPRRSEL
ncbi:hypothetical protein FIBSPDRAFT_755811 [Athelia psychrophila]|uniref:Uncharacterized protein n=1 Tax=Athelia psychrophila TaxID=1759441 RepID=A0A166AUL7_9AGAM|nr:hypothetical protein FIBSPDRAFT_755811 [Fibularhizoctonia sp. CBS 109695]